MVLRNERRLDRTRPAGDVALIEVNNVTRLFAGGPGGVVRALQEVSMEIHEGEFVSLLGPSGCGKSTMLSIIAGLLPPSRGIVRIAGQEVTGPQTSIGLIFQSDVLLEWRSALDNVLLQMEARGMRNRPAVDRARELLGSMGLDGFDRSFPFQLSGGMRQRVAICRALIHDPKLLLMDEPFGPLDALTRDQLGLDLLHLWDEHPRTALFVTHSIAEAVFLSDRVIVMTPRPGQVADIVDIQLPRPRTGAMRKTTGFLDDVARIRNIFLARGVLRE